MKKILLRHVGNMGDLVFFVLPVLETLKRVYPDSHITLVTAWGFKTVKKRFRLTPWPPHRESHDSWGKRNQDGFCISLMAANPYVDELIHYHDTKLSLDKNICQEEGVSYATWNKAYYEEQKKSGGYDLVAELDIGVTMEENPLQKMYEQVGLSQETYSNYKLFFSQSDREIAQAVTKQWPKQRIIFLEGLDGETTRGWDPAKTKQLAAMIQKKYNVAPIWFGGRYIPTYQGKPLTLRQNIATLTHAQLAVGVLSGPLHFAAAVGLPTITLYADQPIHRTAPAYFLNPYIHDPKKYHRTILGPSNAKRQFLKNDEPSFNLTPQEKAAQHPISWQLPGKQSTKSPLAVITAQEVMAVIQDMLP